MTLDSIIFVREIQEWGNDLALSFCFCQFCRFLKRISFVVEVLEIVDGAIVPSDPSRHSHSEQKLVTTESKQQSPPSKPQSIVFVSSLQYPSAIKLVLLHS